MAVKHPPPAESYLRRIENLEKLYETESQRYAAGHALPNEVLVLLDAVDGGQRADRGKANLHPNPEHAARVKAARAAIWAARARCANGEVEGIAELDRAYEAFLHVIGGEA